MNDSPALWGHLTIMSLRCNGVYIGTSSWLADHEKTPDRMMWALDGMVKSLARGVAELIDPVVLELMDPFALDFGIMVNDQHLNFVVFGHKRDWVEPGAVNALALAAVKSIEPSTASFRTHRGQLNPAAPLYAVEMVEGHGVERSPILELTS